MLGLYHSLISIDTSLIDKNPLDNHRFTTKSERYENKIKSNFKGERVIQAISIIHNYSILAANSTQMDREFYKKSQSYAKLSNICSFNNELTRFTPRKFSTSKKNSFKIHKKENCMSKKIKSPEVNDDKIISIFLLRIISLRKNAAKLISSSCKKFLVSSKLKKEIVINKIKILRQNNSIIIQKHVRRYRVRKHISTLRNGYDLIFFYDYKENHNLEKTNNETKINSNIINYDVKNKFSTTVDNESNGNFSPKEIKIRLFKGKSDAIEVEMRYTKILKIYYLPFNKKGVMRKRFLVNFVVDGKIVIDPRFELDNDEHGNFFNIIESSSFKKKNFKPNVFEFNKPSQKLWENIFEIKSNLYKDNSSVSDISEQGDTTLERLLNKHVYNVQRNKKFVENIPKSILRNSPSTDEKSEAPGTRKSFYKKVRFNDKIEYSS